MDWTTNDYKFKCQVFKNKSPLTQLEACMVQLTIQPQFNVSRKHFSITLIEWLEKGTGLYYDSYGTLAYHNYEYDNHFCTLKVVNMMHFII